jgi:hypothetical protein
VKTVSRQSASDTLDASARSSASISSAGATTPPDTSATPMRAARPGVGR